MLPLMSKFSSLRLKKKTGIHLEGKYTNRNLFFFHFANAYKVFGYLK